MKVHVLRPHELSADLIRTWSDIQCGETTFDSPYFTPEFTMAVANVRSGVEIGVIEDGSEVVGFFPFERFSRRIGKPVGAEVERLSSDHQAIARIHRTQKARSSVQTFCLGFRSSADEPKRIR